mgnify:CR=1 FL=1
MAKPIPDDLPLHPTAVGNLHTLKTGDEAPLFAQMGKELSESLEQLLELADGGYDISDAVKSLSECAGEADACATQMQELEGRLGAARNAYAQESKQCSPVSVDTWVPYTQGELVTPSLGTLMASASAGPATSRKSLLGPDAKMLRVLPLLWADPRAVIPDENADSDDIMIDGGHIDLTCPITCKMYVKPMISRKCQHVFDYDGIREYIGSSGGRDCPQAGCVSTLTMRDFAPDPVMALRCRLATIQGRQESGASQQLEVL